MRATAKPLVSVIIPTYNRAEYLPEAIKSVLSQVFDETFEIIIIDDGSTDGTQKVIEKFENEIRYYKIPHSGVPAVARNYGIKQAKGELIAFQDSDDIWAKGKLSTQASLFEDDSVVLSYGQAEIMDKGGKKTHKKVVEAKKIKNGESFAELVKENVISTLTVMARKSALEAVGYFDESLELQAIEDYHLWLRVVSKFPQGVRAVNKTLALYRTHDKNISLKGNDDPLKRIISVYNVLWENWGLSNAQRKSLEEAISTMHENWSRWQTEAGNVPAISVVMGVYKDEKHVKEAIKSILDQSFTDFEFIIIDDGSLDKSAKIVSDFKDPRIRLVHQTNHGLVHVLNHGIKLARAEIIARMDADDISDAQRFKKELPLLLGDERAGVVGSFFSYIDEQSKPLGKTITSMTKHIDIVRHFYFDNPIGHGTAMMRKKAIDEVGGYSDKYGPNEDYDLWRRLAEKGWRFRIIPESLYLYRINYSGISKTNKELQHRLFAKLISDIWKGPLHTKSLWAIFRDARYYHDLSSKYSRKMYDQYKNHQVRLTFEFLIHGHLIAGYKNWLAAVILAPKKGIKLWRTMLWAPIKLVIGRAE